MRTAPFLAFLLFLGACASTSPVAIRAGDVCFHCRQPIAERALAAEILSDTRHAFKFSSVTCLTEYLREHPEEAVAAVFVTDYPRVKLMPAEHAHFVKFEVDPRVRTLGYAAFRQRADAEAFAAEKKSSVVSWAQVLEGGHGGHTAP